MRIRRVLIIFIFATALVALTAWLYINKPHRDIPGETARFSVTVDSILLEFQADEASGFDKYFDQVIILEGTLKEVIRSENGVITLVLYGIEGIGICELSIGEDLPPSIVTPSTLRVKGLVTGYDDLLGEVKLREGSIIKADK